MRSTATRATGTAGMENGIKQSMEERGRTEGGVQTDGELRGTGASMRGEERPLGTGAESAAGRKSVKVCGTKTADILLKSCLKNDKEY